MANEINHNTIIYTPSGTKIIDIPVDDDSYRYRSIMQPKKVELHFALTEHVEIPVGAYIDYQGERYTLHGPEDFEKHGTRHFKYKVTFGGNEEILKKYKYKFLAGKPYKLKFPLTGKPQTFIKLLIDNLNKYDSGWTVGICIDATEKLLSFSHEDCFTVLSRLASEFSTEWEIIGKTIHFRKVEKFKDAPLALSYGKGNGFVPGVGRVNQSDKMPVERLYVQGGERNIDFLSYGSQTLLLPKSQQLAYEGHTYQTDADGMCITRADKPLYSNREDSYDASNIYPSRVGTVTKVTTEEGKDTDDKPATFYNIIDTTIPDALNYRDSRLPGTKATIIFQSGKLTGREFDILQTEDDLTGYDHATRTFKLVSIQDNGMTLPNAQLCPTVGDQYAVFNIKLPDAYICDNTTKTGASWDMYREAVRYFRENEEQQFTFKGELDGIWAKKNWLEIGGKLVAGGYVLFSDTQFQPEGILIRITGVTDYINKPHSPRLELSNTPVPGFLQDEMGKIDANEVTNDQKHKDAISYSIRRWRDAIEMQSMLEKVFTDYGKGQAMSWLRTMSVLIGHESLQFRFVNRIPTESNPSVSEVDHLFNYNDATKILTTSSGIIQHMTLGIDSLSSNHKTTEYKYWNITAYTSPALDDPEPMYLYMKCSKTNTSGSFLLSKEPIDMDSNGYYYFLTGALSAEVDGVRSFATLYGFTEIGPGWMRINKIISNDGTQYWDMLSKAFKIGNASNYLSYDQENGLVLKGCMYQSPSGTVDYPEVDRGAFTYGTTYYPGDKVSYEGNIYKCHTQTGDSQYPTNQSYWKRIVSKGDKGEKGDTGNDGSTGPQGPPGEKGDTGYPGSDAPIAIYRGEYNDKAQYHGSKTRVDIVKYQNRFYVSLTSINTDNDYQFNVIPTNIYFWKPFGAQFESIATGLLLAEYANIAGWIYRNQRMESQDGTAWMDGNGSGEIYIGGNGCFVKIKNMDLSGFGTFPSIEINYKGTKTLLSHAGINTPKLSMSDLPTSDPRNYGQLWAGSDNIVRVSK